MPIPLKNLKRIQVSNKLCLLKFVVHHPTISTLDERGGIQYVRMRSFPLSNTLNIRSQTEDPLSLEVITHIIRCPIKKSEGLITPAAFGTIRRHLRL